MNKKHGRLAALTLALACALPAMAQQTPTGPDPSLPGSQTAAAMASTPATPAGAVTSSEQPGVTPSDIAGTPVASSTPSNATIASDPTMASAMPSSPAISSDAVGTSTPTTTAMGAGPMDAERDEGGFDMGWLGLFGLMGLLGMRRRHHHDDHDRHLRTAPMR